MEFKPPNCATCGKQGLIVSIDCFCSPECRKAQYIKQGWKEPKNSKGWYIATFESYCDTVNFSPEEIKEWNDNIDSADTVMKKLQKEETEIKNKVNEINKCIDEKYPFSNYISTDCFSMGYDECIELKKLEEMIRTYKLYKNSESHKKAYRSLNIQLKKDRMKLEALNEKIRLQSNWVQRANAGSMYRLKANR